MLYKNTPKNVQSIIKKIIKKENLGITDIKDILKLSSDNYLIVIYMPHKTSYVITIFSDKHKRGITEYTAEYPFVSSQEQEFWDYIDNKVAKGDFTNVYSYFE